MVDSQKSGVMFQADPMGKLEELVVVGGDGLGQGIVDNQVETDSCYYNRENKDIRSVVNRKKAQLKFDGEAGCGLKNIQLLRNDFFLQSES